MAGRPDGGRSPGAVVPGGRWPFQWFSGLGIGKEKASFARVPGSPVSGLEALWLNVPDPYPPWHSAQLGPGPHGLKWEFVQSPRGSLKLISLCLLFFAPPQEVIGS